MERLFRQGTGANGGIDRLYRVALAEGHTKAQVRNYLRSQPEYTRHFPIKSTFQRRRTIVAGPRIQFQADLIDVTRWAEDNDDMHWILIVEDCFTREIRMYPLRNKTGIQVATRFREMLTEFTCKKLQTDNGTEFYNQHVQAVLRERGITHFSSLNYETKASLVERCIRTVMGDMARVFMRQKSHRFIEILPSIVDAYNNRFHRSLKMTPVQASRLVHIARRRLYGKLLPKNKKKFTVGDYVRVTENRNIFRKGYQSNWSREIFKVASSQGTRPIVYTLTDLGDEEITGTWYNEELQYVNKPTVYEIEHVIRTRGRGPNKELYVKWLGFPVAHNSWVRVDQVQ
jgi:transposase InsO family protein